METFSHPQMSLSDQAFRSKDDSISKPPGINPLPLMIKHNAAKEANAKRVKKYAPKVRSGCITCKKRRVKCDETKPQCLKCLNSDYQCDGYDIPKAWVFESSKPQASRLVVVSSKLLEEKSTVLSRVPSSNSFTPDEARSLQFYLRRSGKMIAKYDHSRYDFWLKTIPWAAHEFESLKHLLVAVALEDEKLTSPTTVARIERRIVYHQQQGFQKTVYGKPSIENVLLNCLVSFYFEALRSNVELVSMHISSARKIIDEWKAKDQKVSPSLLDVVEDVDSIVTEAITYFGEKSFSAPLDTSREWTKMPESTPCADLEDAEHTLLASIIHHARPSGQFPLAILRGVAVIQTWVQETQDLYTRLEVDQKQNLDSLLAVLEAEVNLVDQSVATPQNQRWHILLNALVKMPKLRSVKYRKQTMAIVKLLETMAQTTEQRSRIEDLSRYLMRAVVYDG